LSRPNISLCPQCHEPLLPHNICLHCGYYKGREIITIEEEK
jgi:large subunit ribosomal protein L32